MQRPLIYRARKCDHDPKVKIDFLTIGASGPVPDCWSSEKDMKWFCKSISRTKGKFKHKIMKNKDNETPKRKSKALKSSNKPKGVFVLVAIPLSLKHRRK